MKDKIVILQALSLYSLNEKIAELQVDICEVKSIQVKQINQCHYYAVIVYT